LEKSQKNSPKPLSLLWCGNEECFKFTKLKHCGIVLWRNHKKTRRNHYLYYGVEIVSVLNLRSLSSEDKSKKKV